MIWGFPARHGDRLGIAQVSLGWFISWPLAHVWWALDPPLVEDPRQPAALPHTLPCFQQVPGAVPDIICGSSSLPGRQLATTSLLGPICLWLWVFLQRVDPSGNRGRNRYCSRVLGEGNFCYCTLCTTSARTILWPPLWDLHLHWIHLHRDELWCSSLCIKCMVKWCTPPFFQETPISIYNYVLGWCQSKVPRITVIKRINTSDKNKQ